MEHQRLDFALKGNILYSKDIDELAVFEQHYLVCVDGKAEGVFQTLPERFSDLPVEETGDQLIIPGLVDLHVHAPQYAFRGLGMDLELLDWLSTVTFPEEAKYDDLDYAAKAYQLFVDDLLAGATTRAGIFATTHVPATILLMDLLERTGLKAVVGKVNMDRNCPDYLCEGSAASSIAATEGWLTQIQGRYRNIAPILTPRFTPACSDLLLEGLGQLTATRHCRVQSHLSENLAEVAWVHKLCPEDETYAQTYDRHGLLGHDLPSVMAHCIHLCPHEIELLQKRNVWIAHCPQSNANLSSGIAPIRKYLDAGLHVGLGSDVAAGYSLSMFRAIADAVLVSKLRWKLVDPTLKPLTVTEAFYLATKGGGRFFGNVGSFEKGYEFDAVILNDLNLPSPSGLTLAQRLERLIFLSDDRHVTGKYVAGHRVK